MMRHSTSRLYRVLGTLLATLWLTACAAGPPLAGGDHPLYAVTGNDAAARYAPVFGIEQADQPYNRIGTPYFAPDGERIDIDPAQASLYYQAVPFTTQQGRYTNHIYRAHFQKIPYRLAAAHISAGRNMGLLTLVTVNASGDPVLITTVHTCGCYLTFFTTPHTPPSALPNHWPKVNANGRQRVWGERPPVQIDWQRADQRPVLWLREGSHRVADAGVVTTDRPTRPMTLLPMEQLDRLPVSGAQASTVTSLFYTDGPLKGYVKGANKPLEFWLVSWWAWDRHVGHDKRYAAETVFYTSLNPRHRAASDMWYFDDFLKFWGWHF